MASLGTMGAFMTALLKSFEPLFKFKTLFRNIVTYTKHIWLTYNVEIIEQKKKARNIYVMFGS